jgi:hypothetical protein
MNRQASLKSLKVKVRWMASRHMTCCQKGTSSLSRRSRSSPSNFSRERPAVVLIFFDLGRRCNVIVFVATAPLLAPTNPNFLWNAPTPAELLIVLCCCCVCMYGDSLGLVCLLANKMYAFQ